MESSKQKDRLIIIFYRNLRKGEVKTRLAKGVGLDHALEIHRRLSMHAAETVRPVSADKVVWYDHEVVVDDFWNLSDFQKSLQRGADLGERMSYAFDNAFEQGYNKVLIIGTDCPGITSGLIDSAFKALEQNDAVIGPAADGGYYLLGLNKPSEDLFTGVDWGSSAVFEQTIGKLRSNRRSFGIMEELKDIDRPEDLEYLKTTFPGLLPDF